MTIDHVWLLAKLRKMHVEYSAGSESHAGQVAAEAFWEGYALALIHVASMVERKTRRGEPGQGQLPTPTPESVIPRLRKLAADWNVQRLVSWDQQANDRDVQEFYRQTNQVEDLCAAAASACEALIRERDEAREHHREICGDYVNMRDHVQPKLDTAFAASLAAGDRAEKAEAERDRLKAKLDVAVATLNDVAQCSCSGSYPCDCYPAGEARAALAKIKEMP